MPPIFPESFISLPRSSDKNQKRRCLMVEICFLLEFQKRKEKKEDRRGGIWYLQYREGDDECVQVVDVMVDDGI